MLDYRVLTFLELCKTMNYRRTAENLNMTQPGVTQHIHFLENHYGVRLFRYDGRMLTRTRDADLLKKYFEGVRAGEADLMQRLGHSDIIELKIGATKTIGEFVLAGDVRRFLEKPNHRLDMIVDNTENLLALLEESRLDFAVIEGVFDKTRYGFHLFKEENFVGVCARTHPFAGRSVSLTQLFPERLILRETGSGTRRLLEQAVRDRGYSFDSFQSCASISNFSVIMELVEAGNCITFAYEPIARRRSNLATFRVEDMQISGEFNFVYCNEETARRKIDLFFNSGKSPA